MRLCLQLILLFFTCLANNASAQSLGDELIAEDPTKLVDQARKNGNVVRGAILFHQGNINCAKCHRPQAERDRIGPDLSRMDSEVTDELIVESILQPSKAIRKEFETTSVVTVDGRTTNGVVVDEDAERIVLRDIQDVDRLITILREDIDETSPGKTSSMPDGLANELKNRQQFLDLLRYVIDVRERGPSANSEVIKSVDRRELSPELGGFVLIQRFNCVACHGSNTTEYAFSESAVTPKKAPNLKWSGKWLNPEYVSQFIANPHEVKPGTTMPNVVGHLDADSRMESAEAITHFVLSTVGNEFQVQPIDGEAVHRGYELFHTVGCVACHSPRNESGVEQPLDDSLPLGDLGNKYNVVGLASFLEDPHAVRSSGRMPNMQLNHLEATDIAHYLLQAAGESATRWNTDAELAAKGKLLFSELSCARCHTGLGDDDQSTVSQLSLEKVNADDGCLSGASGAWPDFHLDENERELIRAALKRQSSKLTNEQQIEVTLKSFNCIACHDRGDFGGVTELRNPHFQTTNLNLGEQGRMPPTLTGVGAKLKSKWMRDVLVNGRVIRPYMKTRMPQYGEENVGHLVKLFQETDQLVETRIAEFKDQKEMRMAGLELAGNKGLNCVACHTYQYKLSDTMPAVDLTEMTDRLKKGWFYQYMLAPQKFSPNTVMPSFWPGGKAIRPDIAGDPEMQVEALWQYLIDGRQARMPSGVVREPLEIVVTNEARMLRRSYQGIGKRGIGVGYPGGVNLAFDAEQMRLAMIWKGKFVDPAGVWTGQGSGNVRTMTKPVSFPRGPELDDLSNPWIVDDGRPPNHQFKGYSLDKTQRPTFRYTFEHVEVEDFFSEFTDETTQQVNLRRSVALVATEQRDDLAFRIVSGNDISAEANDLFLIDKQLKIRVVSGSTAKIVEREDGKQLQIQFDLAPGQERILIIEYFLQ